LQKRVVVALGSTGEGCRLGTLPGVSASERKLRSIARPTSPDFSGWNCTAATRPRCTPLMYRSAP